MRSWPLDECQLCVRLRVPILLTDDEIDRYIFSHVVVEGHNFFRRKRLSLESLHLPCLFVLREASTTALGVSTANWARRDEPYNLVIAHSSLMNPRTSLSLSNSQPYPYPSPVYATDLKA